MELDIKNDKEFQMAYDELGEKKFNKHLRKVFEITCLDFVKSIVINLPEPCYANCEYCIDNYLRYNKINTKEFLEICKKVLEEFPKAQRVTITGGSLNYEKFNYLIGLIKEYLPDSSLTWNTNGIGLNENYLEGISKLNHINLHRNSPNEDKNKEVFRTNRNIITIEDAKSLLGENLSLRITIDETFDLDEYSKLGIPLYLNRLLPGTEISDKVFNETLKKLNITDSSDIRRRNVYLTAMYNEVPIRICVGDKLANHIPGRRPTYLNVAIIHRSGIVCGSWYEDDKVIYNPYKKIRK